MLDRIDAEVWLGGAVSTMLETWPGNEVPIDWLLL